MQGLGSGCEPEAVPRYAMTAAAREEEEAVELLLRAGAGQEACEEAVVEASRHGLARIVELIVGSILSALAFRFMLATAASRGFVDVVDTLLKIECCCNHKPSLHASADCTALIAAIVSRADCRRPPAIRGDYDA
ncbi:hypothetical protein HPP92_027108 [Vanilla planifolia]|uniref:Uncharacterized protein n=1 Tax=Vanilla planifolia TaxID=51239 RepID=A0A835U580_VANPL|nr:hypothetical protein HPP92_027108 [Vanilla planifolia]